MRIKIRPSHRHVSIVAWKTRKPFCGVPLIPALSRAIFSRRRHARRTFSLSGGAGDYMEESIFQPYLGTRTILKMDREILRPSYLPDRLPHRESHIGQLAQILVTALKGERPSNVLIFGKTGTGKTAVVKYIENEFRKADGARMVQYLYLNCEIVDTPYGVLQSIGNKFIENFHQRIPFTGLSTDRVYSLLLEKLDEEKRVVIVALDEIDKLVRKNTAMHAAPSISSGSARSSRNGRAKSTSRKSMCSGRRTRSSSTRSSRR